MTQILSPCILVDFQRRIFRKQEKNHPNTSLVGTQVFVAQCSSCFGQNYEMESKFKSEKKRTYQTAAVSILGFEFGCLQEEINIRLELQMASTFSAAQIQDAGLK